jgi:hypothetical protein
MAEGPLSCAVAYATDGMAPRSRLLWDYDGGARSGSRAFSIDLAGICGCIQPVAALNHFIRPLERA